MISSFLVPCSRINLTIDVVGIFEILPQRVKLNRLEIRVANKHSRNQASPELCRSLFLLVSFKTVSFHNRRK